MIVPSLRARAKRQSALIALLLCAAPGPIAPLILAAHAAPAATSDQRPYDTKLYRLAEILGAIHYLRELCDGEDGQRWRDAVSQLIKTEGSTALRKATIAQRFNLGYRSYRRTYRNCTPSAKSAVARFLKEAIEISDSLAKLGD